MTETVSSRMFRQACAFADCAEYCETEPSKIRCRTRSHSVAGVVNSAFACEVFIKALLAFRGVQREERKGHSLEKLWRKFKGIDTETALSVERAMREAFCSTNGDMFDRLLRNISGAFEHFRYVYEKESSEINLQFLRFFRIALRDVCCRQLHKKPWNQYMEDNQE